MPAKLWIVVITAVATLAIAWLDYTHSNPFVSQQSNVQYMSQPAPDFTFQPIDQDAQMRLSDFKGKTVLINFWASWCKPCLHEYPMLVALAREHQENFILIMLSSDESARDAYDFSRKFSAKQGLAKTEQSRLFPNSPNIIVAWDKDRHITREQFGTTRYPESILINPDGNITQKLIGVLTKENIEHIEIYADSTKTHGPR